MSEAEKEKYVQAVKAINSASGTPLGISDTTIDILKFIVPEEYLDLIIAFKKRKSQTLDQLKENSGMLEEDILKSVEFLAKKGLIMNQPNRSGLMIFRLMPFINVGVFEYTFMNKLEYSDWEKELANLFQKLREESKSRIFANYDYVIDKILPNIRPIDRTIPFTENRETGNEIEIIVNEELETPKEKILPSQDVKEIINKFNEIAVGHCYCRHHNDLLGHSCTQTDLRENCFSFGKSARYTTEQGFARMISKEEALEILAKSEADGLIHKAYHPNMDFKREEDSICNCCADCCGQWSSITVNLSNYVSQVNQELCTGCGTCVDKCPTGSLELNDEEKSQKVGERCIGCGICAAFCPENAISLVENERVVRLAAPRPE